jgi:hypothetical protein
VIYAGRVTEPVRFGALLARLLAHRGADLSALARATGVPISDLDAVLAGDNANPALLRRLAPALGLQTADLFVIAGIDVPDDLAAASGTNPSDVGSVLSLASSMAPEPRAQLHEFIRSLPVRPAAQPPAPPRQYPCGAAGMLMRLLQNRNIGRHRALLLFVIGDGPCVSEPTITALGRGAVMLTPEYVAGFAHVLGIPAGDLAALTGVGPPTNPPWPHPHRAELAQIAWDARRLDNEQLSRTMALAAPLWRTFPRRYCNGCRSYYETASAHPCHRVR